MQISQIKLIIKILLKSLNFEGKIRTKIVQLYIFAAHKN